MANREFQKSWDPKKAVYVVQQLTNLDIEEVVFRDDGTAVMTKKARPYARVSFITRKMLERVPFMAILEAKKTVIQGQLMFWIEFTLPSKVSVFRVKSDDSKGLPEKTGL